MLKALLLLCCNVDIKSFKEAIKRRFDTVNCVKGLIKNVLIPVICFDNCKQF